MTMQTRVFIVQMSIDPGFRLFTITKQIGMTREGYVWITTNRMANMLTSLDASIIDTIQDVLGVKTYVPKRKRFDDFKIRWNRQIDAVSLPFLDVISSAVVSRYPKYLGLHGCDSEAFRMYDKMLTRTSVTWNSMISGYVRNQKLIEALEFFHAMQEEGIEPREFTMVSLLNVCAHMGALLQGKGKNVLVMELINNAATAVVDDRHVEGNEELDAASLREHEEFTEVKNIAPIELGRYEIETWYFFPFPPEYNDCLKLSFCEFCLHFMKRQEQLERQMRKCDLKHPPGDKIYRSGTIATLIPLPLPRM